MCSFTSDANAPRFDANHALFLRDVGHAVASDARDNHSAPQFVVDALNELSDRIPDAGSVEASEAFENGLLAYVNGDDFAPFIALADDLSASALNRATAMEAVLNGAMEEAGYLV